MMDSLSEYPPPCESEMVDYIIYKIKYEFEEFGICEDEIRLLAWDELSKFGNVGSLAGWYSVTCDLLVKNTRISLRRKFGLVIN